MLLTLGSAKQILARYVGNLNDPTERINLVCGRLIPAGDWQGTKNRVLFNVFPDVNHRAYITLPSFFNTVLAGAVMAQCSNNNGTGDTRNYGVPLLIQNGWNSFSQTGTGLVLDSRYRWSTGLEPEVGRFQTFKDWFTPKQLRLKFATTETNAIEFFIRGNLAGQPVYSGTGSNHIEGIKLVYSGGTITSAESFDSIYEFIKPITNGTVSLYTWDGTDEELVAIYQPGETNPGWRRYRVPACDKWTELEPGQFVTICKRAYVQLVNDNDEVVPGNVGAIRFGLEALQHEDSQDFPTADVLWDRAKRLLADEAADEVGDGSVNTVQVVDVFNMAGLGGGYGYAGYNGYYNY